MTELIERAEIVPADEPQRGSRAEYAAIAFLTRYRNERTRRGYEISLRQFFTWCGEQRRGAA